MMIGTQTQTRRNTTMQERNKRKQDKNKVQRMRSPPLGRMKPKMPTKN
jgi:hypothetical protein